MGEIYASLDAILSNTTDTRVGFTQLTSPAPYFVDRSFVDGYAERHDVIREFMSIALEIFDAALVGEADPFILNILLNEVPSSLGVDFHRWLQTPHKQLPAFFRTDEASPGRIIEIQCPGSLWGDHELLSDYFSGGSESLSALFSAMLYDHLGNQPVVHHLLDNASIPHTMRYFIQKTRPVVMYFGIDPEIRPDDCRFIRSHSFFGLMAENWAKDRLHRCVSGEVKYDLPPMVLFDQKVVLALPFLAETRNLFPDRVRDALVYTQLLRPEGVLLEDGSWMGLKELAAVPRGQRRFFLKYGGCDVSLNWGSQAVTNLDHMGRARVLATLEDKLEGFDAGHIWLLQRTETMKETVNWVTRKSEQVTKELHAKFSGFYGPSGFLGACVQHRDFFKVHGGTNTVFNICIERPEATA